MPNDDVLIVGSLSDKELRNSIDALVKYVGDKTNNMAKDFTEGLDKMKLAMKDFAITQKVSVDLMKEAWRSMSSSFDAMVAAQSASTGGGTGSGKPTYPDNTIGQLKEVIALEDKKRDSMQRGTQELQAQNDLLAKQKNALKEETASLATKRLNNALRMDNNSLDDAQKKLRLLEILQKRYNDTTELSVSEQNKLARAIAQTKKQIDRLNEKRPKTMKEVLGMDESSLESITAKMRALKRVQIDPNNAAQAKKLGDEYARLQREQAKLMGKNIQLTHSNNYLAQSFGYIRNRIVYALTLGAVTNFTKQIYEVRGQYELLERSLGILIDNMRRGSEIFNELNAMALKSPFTLMELATGAKQLMAYNFAEDEVVETTRRLADISSALGVPMERLVYNLGQIRAQTVLTARDARDFANAGLAIVPMLADLYTKQKKFGDEIVTTSQVYDMMSNKMVSYADVMKVINSITDEGGKFFDFQAKQAETMKVQMNNLTLAWNNMLNEIGKNNQGLLTAPLKGLKLLFENWQMLVKAIRAAIVALGMYYTRATLVSLINGTLITQGAIRAGYLLAAGFDAAKNALIGLRTVMITNPFGALAVAISTAIGYMAIFNDSVNEMTEYNNRFGESGGSVVRDVEALYGSIESLDKESAAYKKVVAELNQILGDFNLAQIDEKSNIDEILKSREKNIQLIKEEILERKHLNDLQQGRDTYDDEVKKARERLRSNLSNAITENFFGIGSINKEIAKNAPALTNIISDIIESNIELVANKTGDEYEKGVEKIFAKIQERLKNNKALGLSEETINSSWLENNFFRFYKSNIITNVINDLKDAKEANDQYNESVNENYEVEKRAAEQGATFNDRVEQTSDSLLKAANDTDKFYGKINQLIKDYSGQNIIDFLVRVNAEVPTWMAKMNGTELARLSARFAALASQAKEAGKEGLNVNGTYFTTQQLYERAAQYASAVKQKQADTEARKSTTITKEASQALQEYKQSLEAVRVAKNRLKQGTADQTLVTEKETEAQKAWNKALEKGVSIKELQEAKNGKKGGGSKKDVLGDALTKEIQLIGDMRKLYKEYQKAGVDADTARIASAKEYEKTLESTNNKLLKFGIKGVSGEQLATMDARELRSYYANLRDIANSKGNAKGVEALEKAISSLNKEIIKFDQKKLTDSLNNELSKLKDEYEIGLEFDATPELGSMFQQMMGLSDEELAQLPKDFEGVVKKLQSIVDTEMGQDKFDVGKNLNKKVFDQYLKDNQIDVDSDLANRLRAMVDFANDVRQKETKKQIDDWDKLLEKYAEYEYKRNKIAEDAERERQIARKKGASQDILNAIDIRERQQLAKLNMEEFMKTSTWITATGDLSTLSSKAIGVLIDRLEDYKKHAKDLDPKQIKQLNSALSKLYKEQRKNNPFRAISDMLAQARERFLDYEREINQAEADYAKLSAKAGTVGLTGDEEKLLAKLINRIKELKQEQEEVSTPDAEQWVASIQTTIAAVKEAIGVFQDLAKAISGVSGDDDVDKMFGVMEKAGSSAVTGAQLAKGWGAVIGAVVGTATGLLTTYIDKWNGNAGINKAIEKSERAIKRLELAYVDLEHSVSKAYGTEIIGAKRALAAAKELELAELERQLRLEQSRKGKNRDGDKILDLQKQIKELRYEIQDSIEEITDDLLGSDVGSFAENLVSSMIDAFKQGEDYMKVFEDKFDEMIDNLIMKSIVSRVVAAALDKLWDDMTKKIDERTKSQSDAYAEAMEKRTKLESGGFDEWLNDKGLRFQYITANKERKAAFEAMYEAELQAAKEAEEAAKDAKDAADDITDEDIMAYIAEIERIKPEIAEKIKAALNQWYTFGEGSDKNLSALQQGISQISETTANALEAYMNIVAQRMFEQGTILAEIRDALATFDLDVQVSTMGQILLQLQNSYQVQMSIQGILQGWSNANGMAVRVEMV